MEFCLGRLYPVLLQLWRFLFFTVFLPVALSLLAAGIPGSPWEPSLAVRQFVGTHLIWLIEAFLILVLITTLAYEDWRERVDDRLLSFATVKRANELRPGLQSESADITIANFQLDSYLERDVDQEASQALENGDCLIIVGRPLSGKSRTAFEQIRKSPESVVVIPREDHPPEFRAEGLQGKDLILLVDDLHLVAQTMDLNGWINRLKNAKPRSLRVVCTARDGADWNRVEEYQGRFLQTCDPSCQVRTSRGAKQGADFTPEEGKRLAEMLTLELSTDAFDQLFDGTPGSLILDLGDMGTRYDSLSSRQIGGVPASLLINSIKLLHRGGQPRLRRDIARSVAESIRGNASLSNETWDALERETEKEGFGVFEQGAFQTYRPYLENPACISYEPNPDEIAALVPLLTKLRDFEGLFYLGAELQHQDKRLLAKQAYEAAAAGDFGWAANNLGTMLMEEEKFVEAEEVLNKAIALGADLAYGNLGLLLSNHTNRDREAEEAFRAGAAKGIANASFGLGNHLARKAGREADAEAAFRQAIEQGEKKACLNLGNLIKDVPERRDEARQLIQTAIDEGFDEAYNSQGAFLLEDGRHAEAEAAFQKAAESGVEEAYFNLGEMLADDPKRRAEAEVNYRKAVEGGITDAHYKLGVLLAEQEGRESEAAEEFEKAVEAGENDARHRLGMVLMRIPGKDTEAEVALRDANQSGDLLALNSLGALLASVDGKEAQAEVIFNTAAVRTPGTANRNLGLLLARQEGRELDAEKAFLTAVAAGETMAYLDLGKLLLGVPGRTSDACNALAQAKAQGSAEANDLLDDHC